MTRSFYIVYSKRVAKKLRPFFTQVNKHEFETTAQFIKVKVFGYILAEIGIKDVVDTHQYNLYLCRSEEDIYMLKKIPGYMGYWLINKYVRKPHEPYEPVIDRPNDFFISDSFSSNSSYTGNWIDIDMNSAEPYYVSKRLPELKEAIQVLYDQRKKHKKNKLALVSINGCLRNTHVSDYLWVVHTLFREMERVWNLLHDAGFVPFALRRDGILALDPTGNTELPKGIKFGKEIGEFRLLREYGTVTTGSNDFNFTTDMKKIVSKDTTLMIKSELDTLQFTQFVGLVEKGNYGNNEIENEETPQKSSEN